MTLSENKHQCPECGGRADSRAIAIRRTPSHPRRRFEIAGIRLACGHLLDHRADVDDEEAAEMLADGRAEAV